MDHTLADKHIYRNFTRLYIAALTAVAFLSILGQLLVQQMIQDQSSDSWIINYAGRQRFQSQAIVKTALILANRTSETDTAVYRAELQAWLKSWTKYHYELKTGNLIDLHVSVTNSKTIQQMFAAIDPHFQAMRQSTMVILSQLSSQTPDSQVLIKDNMAILLQHERPFLQKMDGIVARYGAEAKARVEHLRQIELVLFFVTIVVLLLEALFVFRPAVLKLRQSILALIEAEYKARTASIELKSLNESLEKTREKLLATTREKYQRQLEEQRLRMAYLIQGQEEERKRLARDLHDGLGQMLTALKLGIENLTDSAQWLPKGQKRLDELKQLIRQTIDEMRMISFDLMPAVLNDFGIASALRLLTAQADNTANAQVVFSTNLSDERFLKEVEVSLYRIAQESLNNAIKYAQAQTIRVELLVKGKQLCLTIADDGIGFDSKAVQQRSQQERAFHGLIHIQERARLIDGQSALSSATDEGTTIRVTVPVLRRKHTQYRSQV